MRNTILLCALLLSACASTNGQPSDGALPLYLTNTPASTPTPNVLVVVETPAPTSTPSVYVIQSGDTISEIAEKFKVSQDDLIAANPDLRPNSLTIGQTILIPDPAAALAAASTPTPVSAPITQTVCHPSADSGLWCFALVHNNTDKMLENVVVQITLFDANGAVFASQSALLPLDILPANSSMPAYLFFPNAPADATPQAQLLSAFAVNPGNDRYLPAILDNTLAQVHADGRTAQVSGQIHLPAESQTATRVWVAAVAYDRYGTVIGVKRWEGGTVRPGAVTNFNFVVASPGSRIEAVEFFVEAGP